MSRNHEQHALKNPGPYNGMILHPNNSMNNEQFCSIIDAANYRDVYPIIERFGDWVITEFGIECLRLDYFIIKGRLFEDDWESHVCKKTWVNPEDFRAALTRARTMANNNEF